ncbi:MAG: lanthionine synthetase LanC family protein, partial [Solirubrobacteraceae bacterium]
HGGVLNWPTAADSYWVEQFPTRVQWCHGAPGVITSLAELPRDQQTDDLLSVAGELVWRAGPLKKGPGLCHGTAGNGCCPPLATRNPSLHLCHWAALSRRHRASARR